MKYGISENGEKKKCMKRENNEEESWLSMKIISRKYSLSEEEMQYENQCVKGVNTKASSAKAAKIQLKAQCRNQLTNISICVF
jgi:hypothetical protein